MRGNNFKEKQVVPLIVANLNMKSLLHKIVVIFAILTVISRSTIIFPDELRLKRLNYCLKENKMSYSDKYKMRSKPFYDVKFCIANRF